jgi:phosphoribosylanthranilate isomerase
MSDLDFAQTKKSASIRVKVCGLTRLEDALLAAELGAFALGFVFYPPSPRAVSPEVAAKIISVLPASAWKVGVFVNATYAELTQIADAVGLTHLQLHGNETPELCDQLAAAGYRVIKALRPTALTELEPWLERPELLLLDAAVPGIWGGSGQRGDWSLAAEIAAQRPIFLAGGLNPGNVLAACEQVQAWGLDLSSGLEAAPGQKDPKLLQTLFRTLNSQSERKHS